jgi:hypothetical protein
MSRNPPTLMPATLGKTPVAIIIGKEARPPTRPAVAPSERAEDERVGLNKQAGPNLVDNLFRLELS